METVDLHKRRPDLFVVSQVAELTSPHLFHESIVALPEIDQLMYAELNAYPQQCIEIVN